MMLMKMPRRDSMVTVYQVNHIGEAATKIGLEGTLVPTSPGGLKL